MADYPLQRLAPLLFFLVVFWNAHLTAQMAITAYPDNSPAVADWVEMGLKNPDEIWQPEDYQAAIQLFDEIYEIDKFSLPRKGSTYSGSLFERLINLENFQPLIDEEANLGNRIIWYEKVRGLGFRMLIYYIEESEPEERFGAEVLDCLLLDAWLNLQAMQLYEELKLTLSPNQQVAPSFKNGYDKVRREYRRSMEELFYVLEIDYQRYDEKLIRNFSINFAQLAQQFGRYGIAENYRVRVHLLSKNFPDKEVRKLLK